MKYKNFDIWVDYLTIMILNENEFEKFWDWIWVWETVENALRKYELRIWVYILDLFLAGSKELLVQITAGTLSDCH